ncbi:uncharacterized protein H6S33_000426 [Morchella sextelata]|uniref:uncharacterized protein n=1 Tax=Morchella sextelata TaxID=1174677 RepID=UPI001D05815F|nr:uncharacterized protein H6S33_000426 [Morchella sextelata]KAH0614790.1 hypothetical protein H6S33_000426 [Morchella sextelata]
MHNNTDVAYINKSETQASVTFNYLTHAQLLCLLPRVNFAAYVDTNRVKYGAHLASRVPSGQVPRFMESQSALRLKTKITRD